MLVRGEPHFPLMLQIPPLQHLTTLNRLSLRVSLAVGFGLVVSARPTPGAPTDAELAEIRQLARAIEARAAPPESAPGRWLPAERGGVTLPLATFRDQLFAYNEQVQIQLLGVLVAEQSYRAARGAFEPTLVTELEHADSLRPNTAEQSASQSGLNVFDQRNTTLSNGVEQLLPSNGRVRLGFNVFDLRNNLQLQNPDRTHPEYSTFFGLNLTQPLLKGAGRDASMSALRLAARESEMAFQEYRRQMMATVASAEAAYWTLYITDQEVAYAQESLALARTILSDTEKAAEAGRSTEAEALAARVAVLERESTLSLARQQRFEAGSTLLSYFSATPARSDADLPTAVAPPDPGASAHAHLCDGAFESNPDYLRRLTQVEIEGVRVAYAKNQNRLQLDLKASYGLNGLGDAFGSSLDDIGAGDYPAWSLGLQLRAPLGGDRVGLANLTAAQARKAQALLGLKEAETQLTVAMENATRAIETAKESYRASQAAVDLRAAILADERERLDAGRSNIRNVFEVEEEYERSKASALRALLDIQTASLQLELVTGSVLAERGWEVSYEQLRERTDTALAAATEAAATPQRPPTTDTESTDANPEIDDAPPPDRRPRPDPRAGGDGRGDGTSPSNPNRRGLFERLRSGREKR